jgi:hypothetical protein
MKHEDYQKEFLDRVMDVACLDLELDNGEIIDALIRYHERYMENFPTDKSGPAWKVEIESGDDAWRKSVIDILKKAKAQIEKLG